MELEKDWDNNQAIFQPLTDTNVRRSFNINYEEFVDRRDSI